MAKQKGRGRLSSLDLLPPEAQHIVEWAGKELAQQKRTQQDIWEEFNTKLLTENPNIKPISSSAFNRHSIRQSMMSRRLILQREITASMAEQLGEDSSDDTTIIAAEAIKTLIFELLSEAGEAGMSAKEVQSLSTALKQATHATHISTDRRERIQAKFEKNAVIAIDKVAKLKGVSADTVKTLKAALTGANVSK